MDPKEDSLTNAEWKRLDLDEEEIRPRQRETFMQKACARLLAQDRAEGK